jgi:hypothetical protein
MPPVRTPLLVGGLALAAGLAIPAHAAPPRDDGPVRAQAAQCVGGVQRGGTFMQFRRVSVVGTLPPVVAARTVVFPACHDTIPPLDDSPTTGVAYQRRGIPAGVALFESRSGRRGTVGVYLAVGTYPELRDHPLHRFLYGSRSEPDAIHGRRCRPTTITALAGVDGLIATRHGQEVGVTVDAATRIRGTRVGGVPRLDYGMAVHVQAVDCGAHGGLVARVVTERRSSGRA